MRDELPERVAPLEVREFVQEAPTIGPKKATAAELRGVFDEAAMKELLATSLADMEMFRLGHAPNEGSPEPMPTEDCSAT